MCVAIRQVLKARDQVSHISSDGSRIRKYMYAVCLPVALLTLKLMYIDMIFSGEMCVIILASIASVSDPVDRS